VASEWLLSWDSQSGIPKLSRFELSRLWDFIAPRPDLRSEQGLNQCCSLLRDLSNAMLHSWSAHQESIDSRLLMVESQTVSLTPDPSFAHNLGCKCPNDQCEAILYIYTSRPFQWHEEHPNARCFGLCCRTLKIWESRRTPSPQLWECEFHPHTWPKWGCDILEVDFFLFFPLFLFHATPNIWLLARSKWLANCILRTFKLTLHT